MTEEDAVAATSGDVGARKEVTKPLPQSAKCQKKTLRVPIAMAAKFEDLSSNLSSQLTELLVSILALSPLHLWPQNRQLL